MTDIEIQRINELARKSKTAEGLTNEEKVEQTALRRAYVNSVVGNLRTQLDSTKIKNPDGTVIPLTKKDKP